MVIPQSSKCLSINDCGGVYTHQRAETSEKRVFILTRSAFAGQQRYGSVVWSGDVVASWETLRNQISAGLNFSLCGIPYWNSDIGGFSLEFSRKLEDPNYRNSMFVGFSLRILSDDAIARCRCSTRFTNSAKRVIKFTMPLRNLSMYVTSCCPIFIPLHGMFLLITQP